MKDNIIIILLVTILALGLCKGICKCKNGGTERYKIVPTGISVVLLDTKTGETWRTVVCSEKSTAPACWEKMNFIHNESFILPIGEQRLRNKELPKYIKKMKKEQAKEQKKHPMQMPMQQGPQQPQEPMPAPGPRQ